VTTVGGSEGQQGLVEIEDLVVDFGDGRGKRRALGPLSLRLEPGTFTAIVGPTGCGKSTLLNVIAGFVTDRRGSVTVDGQEVVRPSPRVGIVFQQYALFPWFSARGNVEFALKQFGMDRRTRRAAAMDALQEVGLADRARQYPGELSGGMKQRVALARTFAGRPKVLLMDEPFGALDAQTRLDMQELLMEVWQARGTTVLFITHDVDEALLLSDRVHVMSAGPGRIIKTIEVDQPRPRSVDETAPATLQARALILHLLREERARLSQSSNPTPT